jgi:hypothetical protein
MKKIVRLTESDLKRVIKKILNEEKTYQYNDRTLNKKGEFINGEGTTETLTNGKIEFEMGLISGTEYEFYDILVTDSDDNIVDVPENDVESYLKDVIRFFDEIYTPLKGSPCQGELTLKNGRMDIKIIRYDEIDGEKQYSSDYISRLLPLKYTIQKLPKTKMDKIKWEKRKEIENKLYRDGIDKSNKKWDDDNRKTYKIEAKFIDDNGESSTMFYGVKADSESDAIKKGKSQFRQRVSNFDGGIGFEKIISIKISDKNFSDMDDEK